MSTASEMERRAETGVLAAPVAVLIPAYKPNVALVDVVRALIGSGITAIVVVDDGSGAGFSPLFSAVAALPGVQLVRHAVNLGKGAALKTGINAALVAHPELAGIVTADADGQHHPEDVLRVAQRFAAQPDALVLGAREFAGPVPLRSRFGNTITQGAMRFVAGQSLSDTQTGLRAIPRGLAERMLSVSAAGYEFELEMLIAAKHLGFPVVEEPIRTIYEEGNPTSHFDPLRDSMRIYFVLLRFAFISLLTACLDNLVFYFLYRASGIVAVSMLGARAVALAFNYAAVRRAVFLSREQHRVVLPRYLLLAALNVCLAYALITFLTGFLSVRVITAKISVETFLFMWNFVIQRDLIFARRYPQGGALRPQ